MSSRTIAAALVGIALLLAADRAWAQSFGTRTLGSTVSQRPSMFGTTGTPGAAPQGYPGGVGQGFPGSTQGTVPGQTVGPGPGSVLTSGRFLRQNRAPGSFVGTDARDATHFVGGHEGNVAAASQSAVTAARPGLAGAVNRTLVSPAAGPAAVPRAAMYQPRLEVGFNYGRPATKDVSSALAARLEACPELQRTGPIAVSLEGRTATLRGMVASERDRSLAQLLILFEPGISAVRNELTIPTPAAGPPNTPALRPPERPVGPREF